MCDNKRLQDSVFLAEITHRQNSRKSFQFYNEKYTILIYNFNYWEPRLEHVDPV